MYFPTTRVLTVLELLQSHAQLSGPELAARLEVDVRTIRRYILMLQDLGIPVETVRGRYGAYRIRPGFKLPPLMFNDDEALALTLGLLVARRLNLTIAAPAVEGALAKIERVLPDTLRERVQAVQETLILDVPAAQATPSSEIIGTLCTATQQCRRVWLRYQAWEAEVSERCADLYGLVFRSGFWYAAGYCHLRQDMRVFRLDRILEASICEETFSRPTSFDILSFVVRSIAQTPGKWLVDVLLQTTLEKAQHMLPPALATLDQTEEGVVFRCYVDSLNWIGYVLIGCRCPFIIRQPAELRDVIRQIATGVVDMVT